MLPWDRNIPSESAVNWSGGFLVTLIGMMFLVAFMRMLPSAIPYDNVCERCHNETVQESEGKVYPVVHVGKEPMLPPVKCSHCHIPRRR